MNRRFLMALAVAVMGGVLIGPDLGAGEKKDKEKEKPKIKAMDNIVINSELITADIKDKAITNSYCKTFTFKMEKDRSYQIEMTGVNLRPYLRLENSAGQQVGADFDRFGNQSAVLVHRSLKAEDYTIIATTLNAGSTGKFTLTVKELTGDEGKPIELKLEKGVASYKGALTRTDPKYAGNKIHKLFTVKLQKDSTYQIDHISANMDCYLYLIGPDGNVLAQDDDGGDGLNSRISHKAGKTGEYRIVATSLGGSSVGAFTFSVRQTGGNPPPDEKKNDKDKK